MHKDTIQTNYRNGNLHINLKGYFNMETALKLSNSIARHYCGQGKIFIHTNLITTITPESRRTFAEMTNILGLPPEKMFLTGANGIQIGPDKSKVIIYKNNSDSCSCSDCTCRDRNASD